MVESFVVNWVESALLRNIPTTLEKKRVLLGPVFTVYAKQNDRHLSLAGYRRKGLEILHFLRRK